MERIAVEHARATQWRHAAFGNPVPHTEPAQQSDRLESQGDFTTVVRRVRKHFLRLALDDHDAQAKITQRRGEAKPSRTAANDDDIMRAGGLAHHSLTH